ncbi:MAG: GTP cyclohydrolase II [Succinivibrionaceae bacterium]
MSNSAILPTPFGIFNIVAFKDSDEKEHAAIYMGDLKLNSPILARIHSECLTGDTLFSLKCDCGFQLESALKHISDEKRGILLYVRQEGRGIGLFNKIEAYHLQDQGLDTVDANIHLGLPADDRKYQICAQMFKMLGIQSIKLLTNNPDKISSIQQYGIKITERVPLEEGRNKFNTKYLDTKEYRMGHLFSYHKK